ncbi:hypothetical protein F3087_44920 [Nocardia colli]|uniref:Uncharacterized protein n=1 Tax=Nocardia colli TaxID=2545717 RepID=A0A5N0DJW1_9NOCA|nr:hypothetical protein [Nocardia colli]KAA8877318.1 hypothetical protein F3087_44920 [Nocardia colli]
MARAVRPKPTKLAQDRRLGNLVSALLARRWSPQQIAGWLHRSRQANMGYVPHETICRSLFIQAGGDLRHETDTVLADPAGDAPIGRDQAVRRTRRPSLSFSIANVRDVRECQVFRPAG